MDAFLFLSNIHKGNFEGMNAIVYVMIEPLKECRYDN
jgi:hypothetical protein